MEKIEYWSSQNSHVSKKYGYFDAAQMFGLQVTLSQVLTLALQRKPFAFELIFCWANAGFFTFTMI